jgi:hypothetical protein
MKATTMKQAIGDRCPQLTSIITAVECGQGWFVEFENRMYLKGLYETDCCNLLGLAARYPEYVTALQTHDLNGGFICNIERLIEEIRIGN